MACHINYDIYQYLCDIKDAQDFCMPHIFLFAMESHTSFIIIKHLLFTFIIGVIQKQLSIFNSHLFNVSSCCLLDFSRSRARALSLPLYLFRALICLTPFFLSRALVSSIRSHLLGAIYVFLQARAMSMKRCELCWHVICFFSSQISLHWVECLLILFVCILYNVKKGTSFGISDMNSLFSVSILFDWKGNVVDRVLRNCNVNPFAAKTPPKPRWKTNQN